MAISSIFRRPSIIISVYSLAWSEAGFSRCRVSAPSVILRDGRRGVIPSAPPTPICDHRHGGE
jgi:hypothetical protein